MMEMSFNSYLEGNFNSREASVTAFVHLKKYMHQPFQENENWMRNKIQRNEASFLLEAETEKWVHHVL